MQKTADFTVSGKVCWIVTLSPDETDRFDAGDETLEMDRRAFLFDAFRSGAEMVEFQLNDGIVWGTWYLERDDA